MCDQLSISSADSSVWAAYAGQSVRKREREGGAHIGCAVLGEGGALSFLTPPRGGVELRQGVVVLCYWLG